jgi:hypothetical protein
MSRHWRYPIVLLLVLPTLLPSEAAAVNLHLRGVAEHSVAAVHATGSTTAFAYGTGRGVVAAANSGSIHIITSTGVTVSGQVNASRDGLGIAHISALPLHALLAARAAIVSTHTPKYILGPPLGYEGGHIRSVQMPAVRLAGTEPQSISGTLSVRFLGAPVVTVRGRLIGAVAGVGAKSWKFVPLGAIKELAAMHHGTGTPVVAILIGCLVVLLLAGTAFGISRRELRRDRELDLRVPQSRAQGAAERRAQGPLVRLRTPSAEHEPTQDDDNFEVIVKSRSDR